MKDWHLAVALVTLFSIIPCAAHAQPIDAISREVTIFNDLTNPVTAREAISREVSVLNGPSSPIEYSDAISREIAVFNDLTNPVAIKDAHSREVSSVNAFGCPTDLHGHLSGNLTDDGLVTVADVTLFVDVLIGAATHPNMQRAADMNCDGLANGRDVQPFVEAILAP